MKVKDILETKKKRGEILRLNETDTISQAVAIMVEKDTGSIAIYNGEQFLGMLTFREVLIAFNSKGSGDGSQALCGECLEEEKNAYASLEDDIDQIRNLMTNRHIRYLPVIEKGKVQDIISFYDVARSASKASDFENRMLKEYIGDWPSGGDDDE